MFRPMYFGDPPIIQIPGCEGFLVHVGDNITDVIVYIGIRDSSKESGCEFLGTGFLLGYKDVGYLVTARHVIEPIDESPFVIRANHSDKLSSNIIDGDNIKWFCPDDKTTDLAIIEFSLTSHHKYRAKYFPSEMLADLTTRQFDVGDLCYVVGMFPFVSGKHQNLPLVYSGNIALIPPAHETIPMGTKTVDVEYVEACLIETGAINGASGSPVFVRPSFSFRDLPAEFPVPNAIIAQDTFYLLGVFTGAWFLPPDAILKDAIRARDTDKVPVGLGVVVPAYKIVELLESEPVKKKRALRHRAHVAQQTSLQPEKAVENPSQREDFTALLNAAVRKTQSKD